MCLFIGTTHRHRVRASNAIIAVWTCVAVAMAMAEPHADVVVDGMAVVDSAESGRMNTTQWHRQLTSGSSADANATLCDLSLFDKYLAQSGKDLYVNASLCEASIRYLKTRLAGGFGPVLQADMEIVMCSTPCISSDLLHQAAMAASHCTCTQLSSDSYITQDFCRQNSGLSAGVSSMTQDILARLLCSILGVCGTWECGLHDFMCPRYEWDRHYPCSSLAIEPSYILLALCLFFVDFNGLW